MNQLTPAWRDRLWISGAVIIALVLGVQIAHGSWIPPFLVAVAGVFFVLYRLQAERLGGFILVGLIAGYVVGNRGFAHLMPSPAVPLLPAEAGLAALLALQFGQRIRIGIARRFQLIDWLIAGWIIFGMARMFFDFRIYGLLAVRDFATVYYAVFFYLTANIVQQDPGKTGTLLSTLRIAPLIMAVLFAGTQIWPTVLETTFTLRGVPLIFYKADLVGVFAAIGAVLHFIRFEQFGRWRSIGFSLVLVAVVVSTNNRAALLALVVGAAALLVAGRWRMITLLGGGAIAGTVLLVAVASWRGETWRDTPLVGVYERVVSLADPAGTGSYQGDETANKGDNNRFRLVWWSEVIAETKARSPVFGLGFGYDLAANFLRTYYGIQTDDFTARSPHSIIVTVFARMGLIGLVLFTGIIGQMLWWTWWCARSGRLRELSPVLIASMIFTSACFGVVIEGPMGAVVFWVMLGAAAGGMSRGRDPDTTESPIPENQS